MQLKQLQVIETATGRVLWQHWCQYARMQFHPNGRRLMVLKPNNRAFELFDTTTGELIAALPVYPLSMALSPDGKVVALGLYTGELALVDAMTGKEIRRAKLHSQIIGGLAWTAGGHLLTTGGEGGYGSLAVSLRLWDPEQFEPRGTFFGTKAHSSGAAGDISLNSLSGHILTKKFPPQLWQIPDYPLASMKQTNDEGGLSCNFLSDTVLLARSRCELKQYDVTDPQHPVAMSPAGPQWHALSAVDQRSGLFAIGKPLESGPKGPPASLILAQLTARGTIGKWTRPEAQRDITLCMDFDTKAERLALVYLRGGIQMVDVRTGVTLATVRHKVALAAYAGTMGRVAALQQFRDVATKNEDRILLIDPTDGEIHASVTYPHRLKAFAVSPDRSLIAIAGDDQVVVILDADTLEERYRFRAHDAPITALRFHPTLPILASGSMDRRIKLWDYRTAALRKEFIGLAGRPVMIAFSPNGKLLAEDGMEKAFRLFDISDVTE